MAVDLQAIKESARGRWLEIIPALTSIPAEMLEAATLPLPQVRRRGPVSRIR